jgi:hypothetical protein
MTFSFTSMSYLMLYKVSLKGCINILSVNSLRAVDETGSNKYACTFFYLFISLKNARFEVMLCESLDSKIIVISPRNLYSLAVIKK